MENQPSELKPKKIAPDDYNPKREAFPFCLTPEEGYAYIHTTENTVTFRLQKGPISETGENGCQVDDMIKYVADTIDTLNKKFPCRENSLAITKLEEAWLWLKKRQMDREARGVEGRSKD